MSKKASVVLGAVFSLAGLAAAALGSGGSRGPCGSECVYAYPTHCPSHKRYYYCADYCVPGGCTSGWTCVNSC